MGENNSIRNNLSESDIISSIKMSMAADVDREMSFIVVEGYDDISFLRGKVSANTTIFESYSGKMGVREIVERFSNNSVIGICDRDYDYEYTFPQIFHYDNSCLEMMLIADKNVFGSVVSEYCHMDVEIERFRCEILSDLIWLSYLRKINYEQEMGVRFNGLPIHKAMEKNKFSIRKIVEELKKLNPQFIQMHRTQLKAVSLACKREHTIEELLSITQGHDFVCYFHAICSGQLAHPCKYSADVIASSLRCSFKLDDLKKTMIYAEVQEFAAKSGRSYFL